MSNEQKKDIDSEIGMGNYLLKQVYQLGVTFGGIFGGAYAGVLATLPFFKNTQPNDLVKLHKIPGLKHASANQMQWGGGIGDVGHCAGLWALEKDPAIPDAGR